MSLWLRLMEQRSSCAPAVPRYSLLTICSCRSLLKEVSAHATASVSRCDHLVLTSVLRAVHCLLPAHLQAQGRTLRDEENSASRDLIDMLPTCTYSKVVEGKA